jgi:hypothetical protein
MRHGGQGSTVGLPSPPVLGDSNREGWEPSQAIAIGAAALRPTFKGKLLFPPLSVYLSSFCDATCMATCAVHWCTLAPITAAAPIRTCPPPRSWDIHPSARAAPRFWLTG